MPERKEAAGKWRTLRTQGGKTVRVRLVRKTPPPVRTSKER